MITCKLNDENTVELDMEGEVTATDYESIMPQIKQYFEKHGRMKFLIILNEIQSFSLGAVLKDISFDFKNLKNIGTTAIVGDQKSQNILASMINTFFPAEVKFFKNSGEAINWLESYRS